MGQVSTIHQRSNSLNITWSTTTNKQTKRHDQHRHYRDLIDNLCLRSLVHPSLNIVFSSHNCLQPTLISLCCVSIGSSWIGPSSSNPGNTQNAKCILMGFDPKLPPSSWLLRVPPSIYIRRKSAIRHKKDSSTLCRSLVLNSLLPLRRPFPLLFQPTPYTRLRFALGSEHGGRGWREVSSPYKT